ncbi:nickel/cobalt transporter [Aquibium carbonis]|uniref:Nickel/cobalt efflux system n=1 Tax=Aquibium carbonis TaxID=2495581 RepID=A0A429YVQ6_9HYPH|nr:nickel/cobalt transporter [Aquibium carbonis]RST85535.1 nickel/cobalt transporter [Aquibium carbonis]
MNRTVVRTVFAVLAITYVLTHFLGHAHAQSSLGIGSNEAMLPQTGLFGSLMNWVNVQQQGFYRALTGALKAMRDDGSKLWVLVGLSFAYGVFHAAGPGHGKAVISSYMLANEVALRRGVMLSFVSALLQGATAIIVVGLAFLVLRGTSVSMTDATRFLETASYALVTAFGAWLLWKKLAPRVARMMGRAPAHSLSAAAVGHAAHRHDHAPADDHHHGHHGHGDHAHDHAAHAHHHHDHAAGEVCATCGHSHAPDPAMISGDRFDWRTAWSAVAAVGLRPCSGALIVLTFSFLNGLWLGGIVSVLAMSIGTAITVATLATIAVTAKNVAVALAGDGRTGNVIHAGIEIGGAALVFLLGLVLLTASLNA